MTIRHPGANLRVYFEYWPIIWLWPASIVLMQLTLLPVGDFYITLSVVVCHLMQLYIVMFYWFRRPTDGQIVAALGVVLYALLLGLFARDGVEFGRSLAHVLNLVVMLVICLNARLAGGREIRQSIAVFCVLVAAAALFIIVQALAFNLLRDFRLAAILGPFSPIGPGNEIYEPATAGRVPAREWFLLRTLSRRLVHELWRCPGARLAPLYPVLATLTATICSLAAMATLSLTGVLGPAVVLAGYILFVRDRPGFKLFWLALAGTSLAIGLYHAREFGILDRFEELGQPGTSVYFRVTAPITLISESLERFPFGYPLGQTDFIASRDYYINWDEGARTNIDNSLLVVVFYFGLLGVLLNATYLLQAARYLILKRHAVGLIMLGLLIALAASGAGWAHHFVLLIGYAIIVGRYLLAERALALNLSRRQLRRLIRRRSGAPALPGRLAAAPLRAAWRPAGGAP